MAAEDRQPPTHAALSRLAANPFVGRAPVLAAAKTALEAARSGRGQSLLLVGEAGIGKTRLADELIGFAQSIGVRPIAARCHELDGAPALWPWIQIARQLLTGIPRSRRDAFLEAEGEPVARLIPEISAKSPVFSSRSEPYAAPDRYALFEAMALLLRQAASEAPLLVVLDDIHWSDTASVLLARYATRELCRDAVVFLGLYRDTDVDTDDPLSDALGDLGRESDVFRLEGLDRTEVAGLVEHVAGSEVSSALPTALQARTGGNPFFLLEILRLLASEDRLDAPGAPTPEAIPLPQSVRHTLERRLGALSRETLGVLQQAGVIGREFDREVLEAASEPADDLDTALDEATTARLIEPASDVLARFRFVHDLIRETLDAGVGATQRAQLHRRAGDAILHTRRSNLEDYYVALARHYLESAASGTARQAVDYAVAGAERAASSYSYEFAVQLLRQALRALEILAAAGQSSEETLSLRGDILIRIGDELWHSGRREEAVEADRAAEQLARRRGDAALLARAAIGLSGRNDLPMDLPDAPVRLLEEALTKLPKSDSRLRVRLLAHLVRASYFGENRKQLRDWADEANAIAMRLGDPGALFAAQESLHFALVMPDHLEERLVVSERLPELARRTGSQRREALAWLWRIFDLILVPDIQATDAAIAKFEGIAARLRQPYFEWLAIGLRATRAQMEGSLDEAERLVFQALEVGQRAHTPNAILFFGTQLFHLRAEQGRAGELLPIMQKIVDERPGLLVFRIGIPLIHALADREEEARRSFEPVAAQDFRDVPRDLHRLPMLCSAAAVAAYLGDERRSEILRGELREDAGRVVMAGVVTHWAGPVDRTLGVLAEALGRLEEADRHYAASARIAERAGARLIEAHSLMGRVRVLRRLETPESRRTADRLEAYAAGLYRERGIHHPRTIVPAVARRRADRASSSEGRAASPAPAVTAAFRRGELHWRLEYRDLQVELPDSKGLAYLQRLIAAPDEEVHVLDLVAMEAPAASTVPSEKARPRAVDGPARLVESSIEGLDPKARRAYRDRLRELAGLREEAEAHRDLARLEAIDAERDQIETQLAGAFGLGGRTRRTGDPSERARKAVYNRIRASIKRIARAHPALARHLEGSVRTGTTCAYRPESRVEWRID